jgi:hypothetical protein
MSTVCAMSTMTAVSARQSAVLKRLVIGVVSIAPASDARVLAVATKAVADGSGRVILDHQV